jgi:hypothetical protein
VQETDECVPHLGVAVVGVAGQVLPEGSGFTDRVAVLVQPPGRQMVGVRVDADQAPWPEPPPGARS